MAAGVAAANQQLARVQQVKRWRLLPVEWTAETEELTPTLKLKRRVVHAKYADVIDSLYAPMTPPTWSAVRNLCWDERRWHTRAGELGSVGTGRTGGDSRG